jgi:hypothetical protein
MRLMGWTGLCSRAPLQKSPIDMVAKNGIRTGKLKNSSIVDIWCTVLGILQVDPVSCLPMVLMRCALIETTCVGHIIRDKSLCSSTAGHIEALRELCVCREHTQPSVKMESLVGSQYQLKMPLLGVMSHTASQQWTLCCLVPILR